VDPLIFGNIRETFAKFIRNGETVVSVRTVIEEGGIRRRNLAAIFFDCNRARAAFHRLRICTVFIRPHWQCVVIANGHSAIGLQPHRTYRRKYCADEPELLPTCLFFEFQLS
jgi:hypothetical protein